MGHRVDARDLVLIVDDERGVRESLRLLLDRHFRVQVVPGGQAAIEMIREQAVGVMLLDLAMPGLTGLETLAKIREIDRDVEVLIVTAYGAEKDEQEARRLGARDWVTKPLDSAKLIDRVRSAQQSYFQRKPPSGSAASPGRAG